MENSETDSWSSLSGQIKEESGKSINDNFMKPKKDLENFLEINNNNINNNNISHKLKEEVLNNVLDDSMNKQDNFNKKNLRIYEV